MSIEQQDKLKLWIATTLPHTTREVGAWIARECDVDYHTHLGLIALLHRLEIRPRSSDEPDRGR